MNLLEYFKGKTSVCATCFQDLLFFKCYLEKLFFWAWEGKRGLLWEGVSFPHIPKWTEASSERPGKWRGERGSGGAENLEPTVKSARSSSHCQIQFKKIQTAPERAKWVQCKNVLSLLSSVTAKNPLPFGRAVRAFPRKPHKLHIFFNQIKVGGYWQNSILMIKCFKWHLALGGSRMKTKAAKCGTGSCFSSSGVRKGVCGYQRPATAWRHP